MKLRSLTIEEAKSLIHGPIRDRRRDQVLTLVGVGDGPKTIRELKQIAGQCGLRSAKNWNVSDILRRSKMAMLVGAAWELNAAGKEFLSKVAANLPRSAALSSTIADVRQHLHRIGSPDAKLFVEEAIGCLENNLFRAAVVFSWVGAIAVLYEHVVKTALGAFNSQARMRDPKWKDARNSDELGRLKEKDVLEILVSIAVIGKNTKQVLQGCLDLRNACGHPTSLKVSENMAAAHLEALTLNVYSPFAT